MTVLSIQEYTRDASLAPDLARARGQEPDPVGDEISRMLAFWRLEATKDIALHMADQNLANSRRKG